MIGDKTNMYAQAYFAYDSKKSGGITMSHLRFGKSPIISPYLINRADFISCSQQSYVRQYDLLAGLRKGGTFLLNTFWSDEQLDTHLPASMRRFIARNDIQFYTVDAVHIARELGLGGRFNLVMQSAFFKLANIIPLDDAVKYLKDAVVTSYGSKGEKVVNMNNGAIDKGIEALHRVNVPDAWKDAVDEEVPVNEKTPAFITNVQNVMNRQEGDKLKISEILSMEDGTFPVGGTAYEKRGTAISVPVWRPEKCIQCNQCSFVCPHATIRPILTTDEELAAAPEGMQSVKSRPAKGMNLTIAVSTLDCLGCGNCAQVCPGKALDMTLLDDKLRDAQKYFDYGVDTTKVAVKNVPMKKTTLIGSQFEQPLFEFSGACAGCGETPYAKLITQLFGDRMMIANATGCSSIWGASAPAIPYTKNQKGCGPAWANSLFEDNAEYGLGMLLGTKSVRESLAAAVTEALEAKKGSAELQAAMQLWLEKRNSGEGTRDRADLLRELLEKEKGTDELLCRIYSDNDYFVKRSQWVFGGDGWAYDIGYGGVDHVLASGEDINIMVFDTEVYSNTGGQASKSHRSIWGLTRIRCSRRSARRRHIRDPRLSSRTRRASITASARAWAVLSLRASSPWSAATGRTIATTRSLSRQARIRSASIRKSRTSRSSVSSCWVRTATSISSAASPRRRMHSLRRRRRTRRRATTTTRNLQARHKDVPDFLVHFAAPAEKNCRAVTAVFT